MAAAPGAPGVTDTDGIPEETDGDGDGDLKETAAEEGEVGRDVSMRPELCQWLLDRLPGWSQARIVELTLTL